MLSHAIADKTLYLYKHENNIEPLRYLTNIEKKQEVMTYLHRALYSMDIGEVHFTEEEYYKILKEMKELVEFFKNNKQIKNKSNNIFSSHSLHYKNTNKNTKKRHIKYKITRRNRI